MAIAAYIFGNNLDPKEVLIPNDHCSGTCKTLLTIMLGKLIIGDVLTLICSMLTKGRFGPKKNIYGNQWFLPPTFSQIVLSPKQNCVSTMKYIKGNFMGDLASLHQIFVPVYLNSHWFLIVDLLYGTVRYLDSFKKCTLMTECKSVINNVLNYIEKFLSDKNFGETPSFRNIQFSKYKFNEPAGPQQSAKFINSIFWLFVLLLYSFVNMCIELWQRNDCGIWVAQWMHLNQY
ncbi:hypothetical protein Ahy_A01g003013 [Arachis hypogaea]|uniref:Ubiquitin-like protease family profile domain-containing protein n=1 Tax=Arachis hypogaea TaxID=3818 RepID=A0A445ES09_ARAHY|nr:hypothetical protein Ahy_A01g003013 [Arachis hypogaea]